jgi:hypothetical protein
LISRSITDADRDRGRKLARLRRGFCSKPRWRADGEEPAKLETFVEARRTLSQLREFDLPLGSDRRLRHWPMPFWTKTGRNGTLGIYSQPAWLRAAMQPELPGWVLVYFDYVAMEFGLAAAASNCLAMKEAYRSGDPYLATGILFAGLPEGATRETHAIERDLYKTGVLACLYGIAERTLAGRLKRSVPFAREFLRRHHDVFAAYWSWSDQQVAEAIRTGQYISPHGWRYLVRPPFNIRSLRNWPIQTLGGDILRTGCIFADELGVELLATAHDAVLIQTTEERLAADTAAMVQCMETASELLTGGFQLSAEAKPIHRGERFLERRSTRTLAVVDRFLEEREHGRLQA